jgi:hypothetical protein
MSRGHWIMCKALYQCAVRLAASSHGRYIVFRMAEAAVPRQMFQEILRLIAELRPQPPPRRNLRTFSVYFLISAVVCSDSYVSLSEKLSLASRVVASSADSHPFHASVYI